MDFFLNFVVRNPGATVLVLLAVGAILFFSFSRRAGPLGTDPEDLVPFYKRFNRREIERGDRRRQRLSPPGGEERRQGPRRDRD
ncbi:MAG: hypothetical protein Q8Q73_03240 [Stagnimonas sp.]|nr:hypothetical protein [Stagnimonas sp.]